MLYFLHAIDLALHSITVVLLFSQLKWASFPIWFVENTLCKVRSEEKRKPPSLSLYCLVVLLDLIVSMSTSSSCNSWEKIIVVQLWSINFTNVD